MSDMYGALRSNEFKVKNVEAFIKWFDDVIFGDEIEFWVDNKNDDGSGTVSFGGHEQYPTAYPRSKVYEDSEAMDEDDDYYIVEIPDLDTWATELREHLVTGEVFQVIAGGNEKLRYVGYSELIIAQDIDKPHFQVHYSDDSNDTLRERMAYKK